MSIFWRDTRQRATSFFLSVLFEQGVDQSKILPSLVLLFPVSGSEFDNTVFWLIIVIGGTNGFCLSRCLGKGDLLFIVVVVEVTITSALIKD